MEERNVLETERKTAIININIYVLGLEFSKENHSLLKKFCDVGLTKRDLIELWDALCVAIDTYHTKSVENVEDS